MGDLMERFIGLHLILGLEQINVLRNVEHFPRCEEIAQDKMKLS